MVRPTAKSPRLGGASSPSEAPHAQVALIEAALAYAARVSRLLGSPARFLNTKEGADLWVDGYDALASTPCDILKPYVDLLIQFASAASPSGGTLGAVEILAGFDQMIEHCHRLGKSEFFHALAAGLCCLHVGRVKLRCERLPYVVANDSLLMLLSKNYRALRFRSFNEGVWFEAVDSASGWFRPELAKIVLGPPVVIGEKLKRVQFYSFAHEVCHVVLFGDVYVRSFGGLSSTKSILLNIEESIIALDLLLYSDLTRFAGIDLRAAKELELITIGDNVSTRKRVHHLRRSRNRIREFQRALKFSAQKQLASPNPVSDQVLRSNLSAASIDEWVGPRARAFHIAGLQSIVARSLNPAFQAVMSMVPPRSDHYANALTSIAATFAASERFFDANVVEPNSNLRSQNRRIACIKRLVIGAADVLTAADISGLSKMVDRVCEVAVIACSGHIPKRADIERTAEQLVHVFSSLPVAKRQMQEVVRDILRDAPELRLNVVC